MVEWGKHTLDAYFNHGAGKIGNYVHLYAGSYMRYGTTTYGPNNKYRYGTQRDKVKNLIEQELNHRFSHTEIKQMEDFLNYVFKSNKIKSQNPIPEIYDKEFQEHEEELKQGIEEAILKDVTTNWDTRNVKGGDMSQKGTAALNRIKVKKNQEKVLIQNIVRHIQDIESYKNKLAKGIYQNENITLTKLNKDLNMIKNKLALLLKEAQQLDLGREAKAKISKMQKGDIGGSLLLKDDSGLVDNINELISVIKGPSINRIKGDLEELIVGSLNLSSLVENRAFGAIKDSLFEVTKKVGDDTSKIQIDMSQFAEGEYLQKMLSKNYHLADDLFLTLESNNASQDKIDIKLEFKNKTIGASVKNVNLQKRKRITLSASGSFLAMIQDYNQDQFINHYLNIMAYHPNFVQGYTKEGSAPYKEYQARLDDSGLVSFRRDVRAEMGLTMLYGSLIGYKKGSSGGKAQLLFINDNNTGKIKIVHTADLLNFIADKPAGEFYKYTNVRYGDRVDFSFSNRYTNTAQGRIHNLLQEIHASKIKTAVHIDAINLKNK